MNEVSFYVGDRVAFLDGDGGAYSGEVVAVRCDGIVVEYDAPHAPGRVRKLQTSDLAKWLEWDGRESISEFACRVYKALRIRELEGEFARLRGR